MKRDLEYRDSMGAGTSRSMSNRQIDDLGSSSSKVWEDQDPSGGMDELLAVLGYRVRSSDMADVAQKLEQLEMVMGTSQEEDGVPRLSETVHYNPSDLSGWVQSMLTELDPSPNPVEPDRTVVDYSEYDLRAIPGVAAFRPQPDPVEPAIKRLKTSIEPVIEPGRPVVVADSQEAGVRLVHTLMACAEAVQQDNLGVADALVKHVGLLAASQAGAMRKVATYFAEALARRIYRIYPRDCLDPDALLMHFYETCPYLKFAHFTANQAILEAFAGATRVHVVDFGLKQGMQWPALMQALALRPGGPPAFRLTGIGPPQPDSTDALQQVGWKLAQLADTIGVEFEFRGFVATSLADLEPGMLEVRPDIEVVAVNSVFELHRLLARPGAVDKVLSSIKAMRPKIVTVVEEEANHNGPVFLDRFNEALHYYSNLFDSLEGSAAAGGPTQDMVMSEVYLGRQICNVVACEGPDRVERHETLAQWQTRFAQAGFDPVHLGSNAFKQASMLCGLYAGGDGYKVDESGGCLMLGWHTRPLIATSAWRVAKD